ncbi:MAG TPA: ATP-binding protein, partial [Anaerolineae bacterium]|nr:ATP-binding protein [Anaerolineae bacterium]
MTDREPIAIQNELDIIEARMHVRKLAREAGLDLFDQARISLATSTMAIILGLEKSGNGSIHLSQLDDGGR